MNLIEIEDLSFRFPGRRRPVLDRISLSIQKGERVLLFGASGSGKSTLLQILAGLAPEHTGGELTGTRRLLYRRRGVVLQNPEAQIITPTVIEELAFPLENEGVAPEEILRRAEDALSRFGMTGFAQRHPLSLSGGECQRLSLACALMGNPEVLFLDEPTSFLDEERAIQFFKDLRQLPPEITVILVEHRYELLADFCHRWIKVEKGKLYEEEGPPRSALAASTVVSSQNSPPVLEDPSREEPEGSRKVGQSLAAAPSTHSPPQRANPLLEIRHLSHSYPGGPSLFQNLSLSLPHGTCLALQGPSGCGKTTVLKKILRLLPVEKGKIFIEGKDGALLTQEALYSYIAYVPQNPEHLFIADTVREELHLALSQGERNSAPSHSRAFELAERFSLTHRLGTNPFKLSEGEKRRLTLCIALAMGRPLIIMDEPTYGLDQENRLILLELLNQSIREQQTILMVSHDTPFLSRLPCTIRTFKEGYLW
ncbi:MAG: ATP-binding cassette domain-containing protein [Treponemataceae bacterium]|nr:ATP-binding cassette domain-containing protein [Treponemataceae bacterium]